MKAIVFIVLILIVLAFLLGLFFNNLILTGKVIESQGAKAEYTWTKAICNSENQCIDVLITCKEGKVVNIEPLSDLIEFDKLIQHSFSEVFCE